MNIPNKLNPDLHAGLLAILALVCDVVVLAIRGHGILSPDLALALTVFTTGALTRWRLSLKPEPSTKEEK
jgi:hypothetical protein